MKVFKKKGVLMLLNIILLAGLCLMVLVGAKYQEGEKEPFVVLMRLGPTTLALVNEKIMLINNLDWHYDKPYCFSADRTCFAYVIYIKSKNFVVYNGKRQGPYDKVEFSYPFFSLDNKNFVYTASVISSLGDSVKIEQKFIVTNNKMNGPFDNIWKHALSSDGKHLAYVASKNGKNYLFSDSLSWGPIDLVLPWSIHFSWDNKHLSCEIFHAGQHFIMFDGQLYGPIPKLSCSGFTQDNDLIYRCLKEEKVIEEKLSSI